MKTENTENRNTRRQHVNQSMMTKKECREEHFYKELCGKTRMASVHKRIKDSTVGTRDAVN